MEVIVAGERQERSEAGAQREEDLSGGVHPDLDASRPGSFAIAIRGRSQQVAIIGVRQTGEWDVEENSGRDSC